MNPMPVFAPIDLRGQLSGLGAAALQAAVSDRETGASRSLPDALAYLAGYAGDPQALTQQRLAAHEAFIRLAVWAAGQFLGDLAT